MLTLDELPVEAVIMSAQYSLRTYYDDGTQVCHSNNGVSPSVVSTDPQAKKCALCFNNQWGSRITPNGKRGKRCSEYNKLTLRQLNYPHIVLSLRVPSASLKAFRAFEKQITSRGEQLNRVVTKIDTTHDQRRTLTFRVIRFLDADELDDLTQPTPQAASSFPDTDGYIN